MAERRGTGGRGSTSTLPDVSLDDFTVVDEAAELSRSRTEPSKLQPLIDLAKGSLGRKIERMDVVMDGNGQPVTDEEGKVKRTPHIYSKAEADQYAADLRNVAQRNKLPQKRLSLRVVADPPLAQAKDGDKIRVQFYIASRKQAEATA
jgi:hypothetical protein